MTSTPVLSLAPFSSTSSSRFQALYSDFTRQKQSNPASYQSNLDWWTRALESVVRSGAPNRLVLSAGVSLQDQLRIQGVGKPLGLGAVISELRHSKALVPVSEFLSSPRSVYDPGWLPLRIASVVLGKPLWWAFEQLGVVSEETSTTSDVKSWSGEYVFLSLVEAAADKVVERLGQIRTGVADDLYNLDGFRREFGSVLGDEMSELDAQVLVKYLERDRRVIIVDNEVVKFVDRNASADERRISTVDRGILELKNAVHNLKLQTAGIQRKMDEYTAKASQALQQKHKSLALSYLKSKKQLFETFERRLGSLQTLEGTLMRVEAAAGDIEIMKSYQTSTETLRALLSHPSLQRDKIEATMDALAEANAEAKEIGDVIQTGTVELNMDEDEIEQELAALARDAEVEELAKKLDGTGLEVPSTLPEKVVVKEDEGKEVVRT